MSSCRVLTPFTGFSGWETSTNHLEWGARWKQSWLFTSTTCRMSCYFNLEPHFSNYQVIKLVVNLTQQAQFKRSDPTAPSPFFQHVHIVYLDPLFMQHRLFYLTNSNFLGCELRPGEDDIDGLKACLTSTLGRTGDTSMDWCIDDMVGNTSCSKHYYYIIYQKHLLYIIADKQFYEVHTSITLTGR